MKVLVLCRSVHHNGLSETRKKAFFYSQDNMSKFISAQKQKEGIAPLLCKMNLKLMT
jgi:hypothetical protein